MLDAKVIFLAVESVDVGHSEYVVSGSPVMMHRINKSTAVPGLQLFLQ